MHGPKNRDRFRKKILAAERLDRSGTVPGGKSTLLPVDDTAPIGDRRFEKRVWADIKMRIRAAAISVAFSGLLALATAAQAQTALQGIQIAQASQPPADDLYSQPVRRPPRRVPIYPRYQAEPEDVYPRYYPGPNAVRVCSATYVQEFRPSGTVIVPHMTCVWRRG
jgi:hypothetical protein